MNRIEATVHGVGSMQDGKATAWVIWVTEYDPNGQMVAQIQDMTPQQASDLCAQIQSRLAAVNQAGAVKSNMDALGAVGSFLTSGPAATPEGEIAATTNLLQTAAGAAGSVGGEVVEGLGSAAIEALFGA